jgi:protocatechuate 3,4-dioxygenase beta subunit
MDGGGSDTTVPTVAEALAARLAAAGPRPGIDAFAAVAARLHAIVAELRPTPADLRRLVAFLTEVGEATDARRQEWVLLADVLGLTAHVEDLANPRPAGATPQTAGPFYRADAPEVPAGGDLCRDGRGAPLAVTGVVRRLDGAAVPGALVEVWHANPDGRYENQDPDLQPEFNLRGRLRADAAGRFAFRSVKPGPVRLPDDGPVGRLARALGLPLERPAHLQFRVTAAGLAPLVTHVFDRDDPAIGRDALFAVKPALLGEFRRDGDGDGGGWRLAVDFVLVPEGGAG